MQQKILVGCYHQLLQKTLCFPLFLINQIIFFFFQEIDADFSEGLWWTVTIFLLPQARGRGIFELLFLTECTARGRNALHISILRLPSTRE